MACDAHCHPFDLNKVYPSAEEDRQRLNITCAASAWNIDDWMFNETLSKKSMPQPSTKLCFAVHPQLPALLQNQALSAYTLQASVNRSVEDSLFLLEKLAAENKLDAVGETGFDFFNANFKSTETAQEKLFEEHLDIAIANNLPLVLHIRKAHQKIFCYCSKLKKLKALVFHSYSGTIEDAQSLLRRGINAYFSFGNAILLKHKTAIKTCAKIYAKHILFETDAPYQPQYGNGYSSYVDIDKIITEAAKLKSIDKIQLEKISDNNFFTIF
ncbi:MAG: hypothetical protein Ta2B_23120 [Termitinemataceae bacterium]|nr:MAG: hypothetical protein Ta2B_23120 [Termitinemataceae bacterium]